MENKIIQITKASTLSISLCRGLVEMKRYLGGERDEVFQGSVALDCPSGHRSSRCDSLESLGSGTTLTPCYTGTRYSGLFAITDDPLCFWYFTANLIGYTGQIC